jgi:hypothetical protein
VTGEPQIDAVLAGGTARAKLGLARGTARFHRPIWLTLALLVVWAGCKRGDGESTAADRRDKPQPIAARDCSGGSSQNVDVNNDGKPDITHRVRGDRRLCSVMDLNFDGRTDLLRFYEDNGKAVALEQHDYDFDGRVDDQAFFKSGKVARKELDTNFDGLIDTWLWCQGPQIERAERARRKPGRVDTWESYSQGLLAEIQYDENSDGKVEKWEVFQGGSLTEVKLDTSGDGKPDRTEPTGAASSDQQDKPISCDGTPLPSTEPKFPAGTGAGTPFTGDAGVGAGDAGAADTTSTTLDAGFTSPVDSTSSTVAADAGAPEPAAPKKKGKAK